MRATGEEDLQVQYGTNREIIPKALIRIGDVHDPQQKSGLWGIEAFLDHAPAFAVPPDSFSDRPAVFVETQSAHLTALLAAAERLRPPSL